jgi:hypothetical protein
MGNAGFLLVGERGQSPFYPLSGLRPHVAEGTELESFWKEVLEVLLPSPWKVAMAKRK